MLDTTLAARVLNADNAPTYRVVADLVTFKATAATTNGAYGLFEARTPPGQGVPPHRQRYEEEAFWVLEGSYRFLVDGQPVELGPGGYVFVPRGTVYAYTNSGTGIGRMLILVSPGGIHERFFAEIGEPMGDPTEPVAPPVRSQLIAVAAKYGIEMLLPSEWGCKAAPRLEPAHDVERVERLGAAELEGGVPRSR
jgi:quercetin dioxygenase-like cupin family protein